MKELLRLTNVWSCVCTILSKKCAKIFLSKEFSQYDYRNSATPTFFKGAFESITENVNDAPTNYLTHLVRKTIQ